MQTLLTAHGPDLGIDGRPPYEPKQDMKQASEHWESFAREFFRDGSLRDIYIFETSGDDWVRIAGFIGSSYPFRFSGRWREESFPPDVGALFPQDPEDELTLLAIDVEGIQVHCHFFDLQEAEFDVDPADVRDPDALDALFSFMQGLADSVGKDVVLTPEGVPDIPIFRCRPNALRVEHTPLRRVRARSRERG